MIIRQDVEDQLERYLAARGHILVTGQPATGKTTLVLKLLESRDIFEGIFAHVDCNEIATPSKLYQDICKSLLTKTNKKIRAQLDSQISKQVDVASFVAIINEIHKHNPRIFIVLDQVEKFKWTNLMDSVVVMATISTVELLMVSIESSTEILNYIKLAPFRLMIQNKLSVVDIPNWTKKELIEIIEAEQPRDWKHLYHRYVNNMVNIMYDRQRNLREIKIACQKNFHCYKDALVSHLQDIHKKNKRSPDEELTEEELKECDVPVRVHPILIKDAFKLQQNEHRANWEGFKVDYSVPESMILMIFAAYVAAHTRPVDDKKNFVSYQQRKIAKTKDQDNQNRHFTLERLLQIYRKLKGLFSGPGGLVDEIEDLDLSDVQLLEDLKLIKSIGGDGLDSLTKYRTSDQLTREYVERLCEQLKISLDSIHGL